MKQQEKALTAWFFPVQASIYQVNFLMMNLYHLRTKPRNTNVSGNSLQDFLGCMTVFQSSSIWCYKEPMPNEIEPDWCSLITLPRHNYYYL